MGRPLPSAFHTRAVLSMEVVTMRAPSELNDAEVTRSACPPRRTGRLLPPAFHTRRHSLVDEAVTMRSVPAERRGVDAVPDREAAGAFCPIGVKDPRVLSNETVTMRDPSGLNDAN